MLLSHFCWQRVAGTTDPLHEGIIYVGKGEPNSQTGEFEFAKSSVLLLDLSARGEQYRQMARAMGQRIERAYGVYFAEKVFFHPEIGADVTSGVLERGRLPRAGANEVVAGYRAGQRDTVDINGQQLQVVGVLKPEVRLFCESYLLYDRTLAAELFHSDDESVRDAYILRLPQDRAEDPQTRRQLAEVFPESEFVPYVPLLPVEPGAFYLHMFGMSLLLMGGALALVNIFRLLAGRVRHKWLSLPLGEVTKYGRLFLAVHLLYFALVLLFALAAYMVPEIQFCLLANVKAQVTGGSGPLAVAGRAYMSKNILRAAVTTFAINFPLGSLICITAPSVIVPGAGALVAAVRAMLWGFLLSPAFAALAKVMPAHSVTLLLEGEGYVLATFFALLIPVYLFHKAEGPTLPRRYGKAIEVILAMM
jgi:hypothetical protein